MMKTALVIMAAGLGSRYGGIKQLEPVGPSGEIIMDYSIYDAIEAGFNKVVFIIRKDLEQDFKEVIGNRIEKQIEVEYVIQDIEDLPEGYSKPEDRTKPWGTGQAVLSCYGVLKEPFAVINADDYYGKEAFVTIHNYLINGKQEPGIYDICMAGFILGNTLSDNGAVTRGVCKVDEQGMLIDITETAGIVRNGETAAAKDTNGNTIELDINSAVSMNLWGFTPDFLQELKKGFTEFLDGIQGNELKAEYLLPEVVGKLVKEGKAKVHVLRTADIWFGVTYKEDKEKVIKSFQELVNKGLYPAKLF
ncbi:MAG: hypothetical protein K0S18_175 [Anaerocolumna sp.]|jgi:dTDP-glucose pyrophosphorylase|nr:hypothetical protein [Anaerocolumna sp.]